MVSEGQWSRVIVLAPPGQADGCISAALREEFKSRDWFAVEHHDACLAMAELCLRDRAQAARAAWGLQPIEQLAVLIIEPVQLRDCGVDVQALISAIARYLPTVVIWQSQGGRLSQWPSNQDRPPASTPARANAMMAHCGEVDEDLPAPTGPISDGVHPSMPDESRTQPALRLAAGSRSVQAPGPAVQDLRNHARSSDGDADPGDAMRLSRDEIDMLLQPSSPARSGSLP